MAGMGPRSGYRGQVGGGTILTLCRGYRARGRRLTRSSAKSVGGRRRRRGAWMHSRRTVCSSMGTKGRQLTLLSTERKFTDSLAELKKQKRFAFDTETDALGAMNSNLIGMSFSWKEATGWYVPVRGRVGCEHLPCEKVLAALKTILEDPKVGKI